MCQHEIILPIKCLLYIAGEYLINFLALCHRKETLDQLIGNLATQSSDTGTVFIYKTNRQH